MAQGSGRGSCLGLNFVKMSSFFEALFICDNIDTILNENFHT